MELIEQSGKLLEVEFGQRISQRELEGLLRQLANVNRQILRVRRAITGLAATLSEDESRRSTAVPARRLRRSKREDLTRACRAVLEQAGTPLTAGEITDAIRVSNATVVGDQAHPVASVTTVLSRLLEYGEVNNAFNEEGRRTWFATRKRVL